MQARPPTPAGRPPASVVGRRRARTCVANAPRELGEGCAARAVGHAGCIEVRWGGWARAAHPSPSSRGALCSAGHAPPRYHAPLTGQPCPAMSSTLVWRSRGRCRVCRACRWARTVRGSRPADTCAWVPAARCAVGAARGFAAAGVARVGSRRSLRRGCAASAGGLLARATGDASGRATPSRGRAGSACGCQGQSGVSRKPAGRPSSRPAPTIWPAEFTACALCRSQPPEPCTSRLRSSISPPA